MENPPAPEKSVNFFQVLKENLFEWFLASVGVTLILFGFAQQFGWLEEEKGSQLQLAGENLNQKPVIEETIPLEIQISPQEQARTAQNLIIAAPAQEGTVNIEASVDPNATAGEAIIPAGEEEIKIANNHLSDNCSIYLAPQDDLENHLLFLKTKNTDEKYFTAALNKPLQKDIRFKWWVIE
jgi:hypothetical protein